MPRECLPDHLKDAKHTDWPWPFSYIPRAWNAYCGQGPYWVEAPGYQNRPIPDPGFKSAHYFDKNGESRPYSAVTYKNGYHVRRGYRWDDSDFYYNYVVFSAGFEYRNVEPV